jgi:hypothetical protein
MLDAGDVALGDLARVPTLLDGRVLGRQAERVVAHRPQDLQALAALEMRDHVPERVVEDVSHVEIPGGVREHLEHVELVAGLRARFGIRDVEGPLVLPDSLPLRFDRLRVVLLHLPPDTKKPLEREAWGSYRGRAALLPALLEKLVHHHGL